jgi:hypothetical protein
MREEENEMSRSLEQFRAFLIPFNSICLYLNIFQLDGLCHLIILRGRGGGGGLRTSCRKARNVNMM